SPGAHITRFALFTICLNHCCLSLVFFFFLYSYRPHRHLHSFPTRRSSDLLEQTHGEPATVTNKWLDEAIRKLLPTHMQLIMGIGTAEEIALAEVKAQEQMKGTKVQGHDADPQPLTPEVEVKCPVTGAVSRRPRTAADPIVWTEEAWQRLQLVPLIARPLARNTVERFSRGHDIWRVTTPVMDENK